jgi:hypothetical protein
MSIRRYGAALIDLSAGHWRRTRTPTAVRSPQAAFGLVPASGLLSGAGADLLCGAVRHRDQRTGAAASVGLPLGERGPLLALLDWARDRGIEVTPLRRAFAPGATPQAVPLATFRTLIVDIQRQSLASEVSGWGLFGGTGATEPTRLLVATDPATTLLATPTAAVAVGPRGLRLLRRQITLVGWRSTERGLVLSTPDGERRLGAASLSAQLLRRLGKEAPRVELRRVPLSDFLTPALRIVAESEIGNDGPTEVLIVTAAP